MVMRVCIGCKPVPGPALRAREFDDDAGVMKKCTLRGPDLQPNLPEGQVPACVSTCPASARHFGDFADPTPTSQN